MCKFSRCSGNGDTLPAPSFRRQERPHFNFEIQGLDFFKAENDFRLVPVRPAAGPFRRAPAGEQVFSAHEFPKSSRSGKGGNLAGKTLPFTRWISSICAEKSGFQSSPHWCSTTSSHSGAGRSATMMKPALNPAGNHGSLLATSIRVKQWLMEASSRPPWGDTERAGGAGVMRVCKTLQPDFAPAPAERGRFLQQAGGILPQPRDRNPAHARERRDCESRRSGRLQLRRPASWRK